VPPLSMAVHLLSDLASQQRLDLCQQKYHWQQAHRAHGHTSLNCC
jgi:hypothetical protein